MPQILLVDDSKFDLMFAERLLARHKDWKVQTADSGSQALQLLQAREFDLVISDIRMPRMDGLELLDRVREQYPQIPVLMITSYGSEEVALRALQQGAASYVAKQHLESTLSETVRTVLTASDSHRRRRALLSQVTRHSLEIRLPNDRQQIPTTVAYLQELARSVGVIGDKDAVHFGVAVEEILVNAIVHGNLDVSSELRETGLDQYEQLISSRRQQQPYRDRRVTVDARFTTETAQITIQDEGSGFDVTALPDPRDPENLLRASGRGLLLVCAFMDEVKFNDTGNSVTVIKRRRKQTDGEEQEQAPKSANSHSAPLCW